MKRLVLLTTILTLSSAATAWCGEVQKAGSGEKPAACPSKSAADFHIEAIGKRVNLTDAQKKAIKDIFAAHDKAVKDFYEKNAENMKTVSRAMAEACKSKDQKAIAKAQKAMQDLHAPVDAARKRGEREVAEDHYARTNRGP